MNKDELLNQTGSYILSPSDINLLRDMTTEESLSIIKEAREVIQSYEMNQVKLMYFTVALLAGSLLCFSIHLVTSITLIAIFDFVIFAFLLGVFVPRIGRYGDRAVFLIGAVSELSGLEALMQLLDWYSNLRASQLINFVKLYENALKSTVRNFHFLTNPELKLKPKSRRALYSITWRASGCRLLCFASQQSGIPEELELVKLLKPLAHTLFSEGEISKLGWTDS